MTIAKMPTPVHDELLCPICGFPVEFEPANGFRIRCDTHGAFAIEDCTSVISDRSYLDTFGEDTENNG